MGIIRGILPGLCGDCARLDKLQSSACVVIVDDTVTSKHRAGKPALKCHDDSPWHARSAFHSGTSSTPVMKMDFRASRGFADLRPVFVKVAESEDAISRGTSADKLRQHQRESFGDWAFARLFLLCLRQSHQAIAQVDLTHSQLAHFGTTSTQQPSHFDETSPVKIDFGRGGKDRNALRVGNKDCRADSDSLVSLM